MGGFVAPFCRRGAPPDHPIKKTVHARTTSQPKPRKKHVNHQFQLYRLARIEGYNITRARLQSRFANGIGDHGELGKAIAEQLAMPPTAIAASRQSEMEQAGSCEGMRLAALEFYWEHREEIRLATLVQFRSV